MSTTATFTQPKGRPLIPQLTDRCGPDHATYYQTKRAPKADRAAERAALAFLLAASTDGRLSQPFVYNAPFGKLPLRPDFQFERLVVEIDEHQHKSCGYTAEKEMERMRRITEEAGQPMVFIRFNPDSFTVDMREKTCDRFRARRAVPYVPIEARHEKLLERINHHLSISLEERNRLETSRLLEMGEEVTEETMRKHMTIEYLYYDDCYDPTAATFEPPAAPPQKTRRPDLSFLLEGPFAKPTTRPGEVRQLSKLTRPQLTRTEVVKQFIEQGYIESLSDIVRGYGPKKLAIMRNLAKEMCADVATNAAERAWAEGLLGPPPLPALTIVVQEAHDAPVETVVASEATAPEKEEEVVHMVDDKLSEAAAEHKRSPEDDERAPKKARRFSLHMAKVAARIAMDPLATIEEMRWAELEFPPVQSVSAKLGEREPKKTICRPGFGKARRLRLHMAKEAARIAMDPLATIEDMQWAELAFPPVPPVLPIVTPFQESVSAKRL